MLFRSGKVTQNYMRLIEQYNPNSAGQHCGISIRVLWKEFASVLSGNIFMRAQFGHSMWCQSDNTAGFVCRPQSGLLGRAQHCWEWPMLIKDPIVCLQDPQTKTSLFHSYSLSLSLSLSHSLSLSTFALSLACC